MTEHNNEMLIITTTCPNEDEANTMSKALVSKQFAGCVQASPLKSTYAWEGAIESSDEVKLEIKTLTKHFDKISTLIQELSSYECPEIIATSIVKSSKRYSQWLKTSVN